MRLNGIQFDEAKLSEFCRRNGIVRLAAFGSVLREDFRADSDVDLLVEFQPGLRVSLLDVGGMAMDLKDLMGHDVDLRTPQDLSCHFRDDVLRSARPLYAA